MRPGTRLARKQHIIPRLLLSNFADANGKLWVYSRGVPPRCSVPQRECAERDFYEYEVNGRKTANRYESWLQRIESDASAIVPKLIERQKLSDSDALAWAAFVSTLFLRTRKVRTQISDTIVANFRTKTDDLESFRDMQYQLLKQGELVYVEELQRRAKTLRDAMDASPAFFHVSGLPRHTKTASDALLRKSWHTVDAPESSRFLTSDSPVLTSALNKNEGAPGAGFGKPNTAVLLPLSPKKLFVASPPGYEWRLVAEREAVDMVNTWTIRFGERNVYSDVHSNVTQALVDNELNQIVFGKNAFLLDK